MEPGTSLGPYEIVEPLGAGGMGEVYRARDTRLEREVAIKVLPRAFARDEERLARLEREARLLASLNHANIATVYGLEDEGDVRFIAMELVEGQSLDERLRASGPIEVEEALEIARQIASALQAAHASGVVHRDLKPANVKVDPAGTVKVLDFGLAKAFEIDPDAVEGAAGLTDSPTTAVATRTGVILGTAAYMSPEQARGGRVDRRSDIWSFGVVLYEMLTGRRAFGGETASDVMASILKEEPDWRALPADLPSGPRFVLLQCLQKDRDRRLHEIADARIGLESAALESVLGPAGTSLPAEARAGRRRERPRRAVVASLAVAAVALAVVATSWLRPEEPAPPVRRAAVELPAGRNLALQTGFEWPAALAPDGSFLVYSAVEDGQRQLWLRRLDEFEARPVAGTEGARSPFLSPDGLWIAFEAGNQLQKVPVQGGAALPIHEISTTMIGGTWMPDGTIVFTPTIATGLHRVDAAGGESVQITFPDPDRGEIGHVWPRAIPGTDEVVFTVQRSDGYDAAIQSLADETWSTVIEGARLGTYAPSGHIVYRAGDLLQAVAFDLSARRVGGSPTALFPATWFDVAADGTLVYGVMRAPGLGADGRLVWVESDGTATPVAGGGGVAGAHPALAPDGERVAFEGPESRDLFVLELSTGTRVRISFVGNINNFALWSPDGAEIVFNSTRSPPGVYRKRWDAPREASALLLRPPQRPRIPASWSERHGVIAYTEMHEVTREDLWTVHADGSGEPTPLLVTPFRERVPMISPDGERIAYLSDESGTIDVYVASYPDLDGKVAVSSGGGAEPRWSADGSELFFRAGDRMMAVAFGSGPVTSASRPVELFRGDFSADFAFHYSQYDVAADGRFLMIEGTEPTPASSSFSVVFNWFEELRELVPSRSGR